MESPFTLPADSYSLTNGISQRQTLPPSPLVGNNLWALGHFSDSANHNLFYFDGIKGGECKWHTFHTPEAVAEETQLELGFEGALGLRMDQSLYLGIVESVPNSEISWSLVSGNCRDFQIGRENVCFRNTDSEVLYISQIDAPNDSSPLPPISPPSCFCVTSDETIICLIGSDLLILKSPHSHWSKVTISPTRSFLSLFSPKIPNLSQLFVSGGHFCGIPPDGQSLSLLPLVPSPSWQHLSLSLQVRDISAISGASLSFLILDRHFGLHAAFLDSANLRLTELPPSSLPHPDVLFTSVRSIRSLFDKPDCVPFLSQSPLCVSDDFYTAAPPDLMDVESAVPSAPSADPFSPSADLPNQSYSPSADLPNQSYSPSADQPNDSYSQSADQPLNSDSPSAEIFLSPSAEGVINQSNDIFSDQSRDDLLQTDPRTDFSLAGTSNQSEPSDWFNSDLDFSLVSSEVASDVRTGSKRQLTPDHHSPRKLARTNLDNSHLCDTFSTALISNPPGRSSEERRTHRRFLRERTDPCPLSDCSFIPVRHDFSYFEEVVRDAETRCFSPTLLDRTETVLFEQEFNFSVAQKEETTLSRIHPLAPSPPPPPSAPPTSQFLL